MMENVFKRRSRQDLKMKFKKEERTNRPLVDKCLSQGLKFDASFFDEESEQEENEEELDEQSEDEGATPNHTDAKTLNNTKGDASRIVTHESQGRIQVTDQG